MPSTRIVAGLLTAALLLSGCSTVTTVDAPSERPAVNAGPAAQDAPQLAALLPDPALVPLLAGAERQTSYEEQLTRLGDEFALTSPTGASVSADNDLLLSRGTGELGWAIYQFSIPDNAVTLDELLLTAQLSPGTYYMAISNYELDRWELVELATAQGGQQALSDTTSRDAELYQFHEQSYVAVLGFGDQQLLIDSVSLGMDVKPGPPKNLAASGELPGTEQLAAVVLTWDAAVGAEGYWIDRCLAGDPQLQFEFLAQVGSATFQFSNTADSPAGLGAEYGVRYLYRVRAMFAGGPAQVGGPAVEGVRAIPPPAQLVASDQLDDDTVYLKWSTQPAATQYRVYLDDVSGPSLETTAADNAEISVADAQPHTFYVRAECSEGLSLTGAADTGSAAAWSIDSTGFFGTPYRFSNAEYVLGRPQVVFVSNESELHNIVLGAGFTLQPEGVIATAGDDYFAYQSGIAEHFGKTWLAYFVTHQEPTPDEVRIAWTAVAEPDTADEWTSYPIYSDGIAADRICLAEVNGRLATLFRTNAINGHIMYFGCAQQADPGANDWGVGLLRDENTDYCDAYDLAEIDGAYAVCYEQDGHVIYGWSADPTPGPSDWQLTDLGMYGEIAGIALEPWGNLPAVAVAVGTIEGDFDIYYLTGSIPRPLAEEDWQIEWPAVAYTNIFTAIDLAFWQDGRPMIAYRTGGADEIRILNRLALDGTEGDQADWSNYLLTATDFSQWPEAGFRLLVADGVPVLVYYTATEEFGTLHAAHLPPPPQPE